ncbi:phospholipase D family protein [Tardiphaga sp. 367_B4_N1_1]|uniref:phospholipase D family protein n=1 Tax=Tardiphaga sp. 367_B4_N1_1 TaxID=3240777 RepID=UPI003F28D9BD
MQPLFLTDDSVHKIRSITEAAGLKKFAVAFWGQGAANQLGISKANGAECRILCDLFSGACNPKEMQGLLDLGCEIKTIDGLHSKIYCSHSQVVIGSSNASSNGLATSGKYFSGNVEANVLIEETSFLERVHRWFDEYWELPAARRVTSALVLEAKPIWLKNAAMHRQFAAGLLTQLRQQSKLIKAIKARVIFYTGEGGSTSAQNTFNKHGRIQYSDAEWRLLGNEIPYYEDWDGWNVQPGEVFLDFGCSKPKGRATFYGIWRVRKEPFIQVGKSKTHRIVLLDQLTDINGYRVTADDQREMERAIDLYMKADAKRWEADRHGDFVDKSFADFWRDLILPASSS